VLLFDPATYTVDFFYTPPNPDDPPLKPGSELQLGRSPECLAALWFVADAEGKKDTGFLKVLLATEGNLELKFMEQQAVIGYDEEGELNYVTGRSTARGVSGPKPMKGELIPSQCQI
jgi:hypothetical protein